MANRTSAAKARSLKHQQTALELRRRGWSYASIGTKIGISKAQAHRLVTSGLDAARQQISAAADELRSEEISRLDGMLNAFYPLSAKGDAVAAGVVLRIGERRAKLLGLEAPVRIETTGRDGAPIEVSSTVSIDPSKLSTTTLRELLDARTQPDRG